MTTPRDTVGESKFLTLLMGLSYRKTYLRLVEGSLLIEWEHFFPD